SVSVINTGGANIFDIPNLETREVMFGVGQYTYEGDGNVTLEIGNNQVQWVPLHEYGLLIKVQDRAGNEPTTDYRRVDFTKQAPRLNGLTPDAEVNEGSIMLSWQAPTQSEGGYSIGSDVPLTYRITYAEVGSVNEQVINDLSTTNHTLKDLAPVTTYIVSVQASAENFSLSEPREIAVVTQKVTLSTPSGGTINLVTNPSGVEISVFNVPAEVSSYEVSVEESTKVLARDASIEFSGLEEQAEYTLYVRAIGDPNLYNPSAFYKTTFMTRALPRIEELQSIMVGDIQFAPDSARTTVTASWRDANGTRTSEGTVVTGASYRLTLYEILSGNVLDEGTSVLQQTLTTPTVNLLVKPGTTYRLEVSATAPGFAPSQTSTSGFTTAEVKLPSVADFSDSFSFEGISPSELLLTWQGVPASITELELSLDGGESLLVPVSQMSSRISSNDILMDTEYEISIITRRGEDAGAFIAGDVFVLTARTLPVQRLPQALESDFTITRNLNSIQIDWAEPTLIGETPDRDDYEEYEFSIQQAGAVDKTVQIPQRARGGTTTFDMLMDDTEYTIEITASGNNPLYEDSNPLVLSVRTLSFLSTLIVTVESVSENSARLLWTMPTSASTYVLVLYTADDIGGTAAGNTPQEMLTTNNFLVTGLEFATDYVAQVIARADGFGDSPAGSATLRTMRAQLPPPTNNNVSLGRITTDTVTIMWTGVSPEVTSYTITLFTNDDDQERSKAEIAVTSDGRYVFEDLMPQTSYRATVSASGDINRYIESNLYTLPLISTKTLPTLDPVQDLQIVELEATSARVNWSLVNFAQMYEITLTARDSSGRTRTVPGNEQTLLYDDLLPNTSYSISIVARTPQSYHPSSETTGEFTTLLRRLLTPQQLMTDIDETTITLSWGAVENAESYQIKVLRGSILREGEATQASIVFTDLQPVTPYTLEVVAVADPTRFRNSVAASVSVETGKETLPQPNERQITITAQTNSISLEWRNNSPNVTQYTFELRLANGGTIVGIPVEFSANDGEHQFRGLSSMTGYEISTVASGNSNLYTNSPPYIVFRETLEQEKLGTVSDFRVEDLGDVSARLVWTDIPNTQEYRLSSDSLMELIIPQGQRSSQLAVLTPQTTYTISIVATADRFIESDTSVLEFTTLASLEAPQNLRAPATEAVLSIAWDAVDGATGYDVVLYEEDSTPGAPIQVTEEIYTSNPLRPATNYVVEVTAFAPNRRSVTSTIDAQTERIKLVTPLEEQFTFSATIDSIEVRWENAPATVSSYEFSLLLGNTIIKEPFEIAISAGVNVFTELQINSVYKILIKAKGDEDLYITSDLFTRDTPTMGLPQVGSVANFRVISGSITQNSATLTWGRASNAEDYLIHVTDVSLRTSFERTVSANSGSIIQSYLLQGLTPISTYAVTIVARAANLRGSDPVEIESHFTTRHQVPQNINTTRTTLSITVSWDAVPNAETYLLSLYRNEEPRELVESEKTSQLTYNFTGLIQFTEYTVEVIAQSETYPDSEPAEVIATTLRQHPAPTPDQISITAAGDNITVSWDGLAVGSRNGVSTYSISILLTSTVGETNYVVENMAFSALQDGSPVFGNLTQDTSYTVTVIAEGDGDSSPLYSFTLETTRQLGTPQVTAVTEDRRRAIKVSWDRVPNAQSYRVRVSRNPDNLLRGDVTVLAPMTTHRFTSNLNSGHHHTVTVTAIADTYDDSVVTSVIASPRKLSSESFTLDTTTNSLGLRWSIEFPTNAFPLGTDVFMKAIRADLFFTIEDPNGNLVVDELKVSTKDSTREFLNLDEDTNYQLRIVLGATSSRSNDDSVVKGEALSIPFKTRAREISPIPTENQIRWTASETEITVRWENTAAGVTTYDLTLLGEGSSIPTGIEVDARTPGSTTFINLNPGVTYTLGIVAQGDTNLYRPSPPYLVTVMTNASGQLNGPDITLSIESSVDIAVSWPTVTGATTYTLSLYSSDGERIDEMGETANLMYTFAGLGLGLEFGTEYRVGVIAEADDAPNSFERFHSIKTESFILSAPMDISLSKTTNSITVRWSTVDSTLNIGSYLLSINPDTADVGEQTIAVSSNEHTFEGLSVDSEYTVSVVSSRDETGYIQSSAYRATTRTTALQQFPAFSISADSAGSSISLSWSLVAGATTFNVRLYRSTDTSATALRTLTILQSGTSNSASFGMLAPVTLYTIEVIAQAENYLNSVPTTVTAMTSMAQLERPTAEQITIVSSTNSVTISFQNTPMGVDGYVLNIVEAADPFRNIADFDRLSIEESPHVFDVLPGRSYNLSAYAYSDKEGYIGSSSSTYDESFTAGSLDALSNPEVTAAVEVRRQDTATVSDIRVAWGSVANVQSYTVRLYPGAGNVSDISALSTKTVSAIATMTVFENQFNSQFFTVGVTAVSDIYPDSEEVRTSVLPPKLLSEFFTVTPSSTSLSLAWDSSFNAVLEDGVYFYDATRIDNLSDSASSLLLISIEDLDGNEITGSAEVSTEENAYSTDG
ncbi:MAG: fibronectin type III domain-containing protein, partial [Candidatus Oxydemutatoraceae bacterium WSBS_2016_MAG_OTU14]